MELAKMFPSQLRDSTGIAPVSPFSLPGLAGCLKTIIELGRLYVWVCFLSRIEGPRSGRRSGAHGNVRDSATIAGDFLPQA